MTPEQIAGLNQLAGAIAIAEVILIFGLIAFRTLRMVRRRESVPLLQMRDLMLFAFFAIITFATQFSRATGIRFSDNPAWVIFTDLLQVAVGTTYLAIELLAIGRQGSNE